MSILDKVKKAQPKDELPQTVRQAEDNSTVLPKDYHVASLRERRLLLALRSVSIGLFLALMLSIVQGLVIYSMFPLKEVRPFLVRISDENSVVGTIRPLQDSFDAYEVLTEQLVRQYVVNRQEILRSNDAMVERWGPSGHVRMASADEVYRRFTTSVTPVLEGIRREDGIAQVDILSVNPLVSGRSYVIDFRQTTRNAQDIIVQDQVYTATMEIEFRSLSNLTKSQMLVNPTGFTVTSYSIAEKTQ